MSTIDIQAPMSPVPATRLRITARGRRVVLMLAVLPVVVGIVLSALAGGSALASGDLAAPVTFETVAVMPGDTLWSIADEVAPGADPRVVIEDIKRLNNLRSGMIQVGAEIAIPTVYTD